MTEQQLRALGRLLLQRELGPKAQWLVASCIIAAVWLLAAAGFIAVTLGTAHAATASLPKQFMGNWCPLSSAAEGPHNQEQYRRCSKDYPADDFIAMGSNGWHSLDSGCDRIDHVQVLDRELGMYRLSFGRCTNDIKQKIWDVWIEPKAILFVEDPWDHVPPHPAQPNVDETDSFSPEMPSELRMFAVETVPRQPGAPSLLQTISAFLWAVGSPVNCGVPAKTYSLQIASGSVVWRSGVGNTDVESINFNSENQAQTITLHSEHRTGRGEPPGTTWSYMKLGPDRIQVTPGGRSSFVLTRCR